jgi:uncharacterized protein Yka (UPF0111/DUF47 family)
MSRPDTPDAAEGIVDGTARYLRRVEAATEQLTVVLDAYGDEDAAFEAAVAELRDLESECDAILGDLRSLVGSSIGGDVTGVYLHSGALVRFYETTDAVVNEAERVGTELAAMEPGVSDEIAAEWLRMAEFAGEAAVHLSRAGTDQVENLVDPDRAVDVSREAEQIRAVESRCDEVKYRVLESAFASVPTAEALAVRALATRIDAVTNAVEDAADRLVYLDHRSR